MGDVSRFAALATVSSHLLQCVGVLNMGRPVTVRHTGSEGDLCDSLTRKEERGNFAREPARGVACAISGLTFRQRSRYRPREA